MKEITLKCLEGETRTFQSDRELGEFMIYNFQFHGMLNTIMFYMKAMYREGFSDGQSDTACAIDRIYPKSPMTQAECHEAILNNMTPEERTKWEEAWSKVE